MIITNLFIIFDPSTNLFQINWISVFIPIIRFYKKYWTMASRISFIYKNISKFIISNLKNNLIPNYQKRLLLLFSFFTIIYCLNLIRLAPFIFTPTSHLSLSLYLSLPFWMSLILKRSIININETIAHLIPLNTPIFLCPFLVIIETIRNIIRPLTLSIRLSANIVAGHIIIYLISNALNNNILIFLRASLALNALLTLEISVSIIQRYVFIILISLYLNEINN